QHKLNIDALIEAIETNIKTPERSKNSEPLMHVLRSFDINKPGLPIGDVKGGVIGGSLIQGDFETGDEIEIRPGIHDEKKGKYEPIMSKISSLGTGAGIVEVVKPGGLVELETSVGTQELVKVDPIKIKESLRLNIGTAATLGTVTHVKDHAVEIKLKKP